MKRSSTPAVCSRAVAPGPQTCSSTCSRASHTYYILVVFCLLAFCLATPAQVSETLVQRRCKKATVDWLLAPSMPIWTCEYEFCSNFVGVHFRPADSILHLPAALQRRLLRQFTIRMKHEPAVRQAGPPSERANVCFQPPRLCIGSARTVFANNWTAGPPWPPLLRTLRLAMPRQPSALVLTTSGWEPYWILSVSPCIRQRTSDALHC